MMCLNRIRLECVVQFNAPSVIGVFGAAGSFSCEVVISVQFNVLLECYACTSYPEMNVSPVIPAIVELVSEVQGRVTEEIRTGISFYIVNTQLPGARFIGINSTIGEACGPQSRIVCFISCVAITQFAGPMGLHVVTVKGEVATEVYVSTNAPNLGIAISSIEACCFSSFICSRIKVMSWLHVESRNISTISNVASQFCIPSFCGCLIFPTKSISFLGKSGICQAIVPVFIINIIGLISILEAAIACFYADFAIVPSSVDAVEYTIFIPESAGLVKSYTEAAEVNGGFVVRSPLCIDAVHGGISVIIAGILEVHVGYETAIHSYLIIDISLYIDTHTAIPGIIVFSFALIIQVVLITHTSITGPVEVAHFLFQVAYANAQVSQFVSVFASQFIKGCTLFSVQLVFFSHEAGDDLSQFVTGHVPFTFEGAVRIAFYDALVGEVGYCLVSPVIRCNIRERICSVCGYASGECCYSSDCENLFHVLRSF